jgi:hypothetical protein
MPDVRGTHLLYSKFNIMMFLAVPVTGVPFLDLLCSELERERVLV